MSLFSEDEELRQAAVRHVPISFRVETPTEIFELLMAFRHAFRMSGAKPGEEVSEDPDDDAGDDDVCHWVAAARFMLEYPRSHWDILQRYDSGDRTAFHFALRRIAHNSNVPIVRVELTRINVSVHNRPTIDVGRSRQTSGEMSSKGAAYELGVTPGALKQLVEAKLLAPIRSRRARYEVSLFAEGDIRSLQTACDSAVSYRWFQSMTDLPEIAVEQLVTLGHLEDRLDPAVEILKGGKLLTAKSARPFLTRFDRVPHRPGAEGWSRLRDAFLGVGGREKPWGPVLAAWLDGSLPGGLINVGLGGEPTLAIYTAVARTIIMGGPSSAPWFGFESNNDKGFSRDWLSPGETASYLNCSAVEISYLLERGHLLPISGEERTRYRRREVEEFAEAWMNTREAAARMGVMPRHLWRHLEAYDLRSSLGRGFHKRDELEPIVEKEVRARRLQSLRPTPS